MPFTRRQFNRLAGLAAVSPWFPRLDASGAEAPPEPQRLRWCIVALGRISMDHFMPAVKTTQTSVITALVSGHRPKAEQQAALYGVPSSAIYSYDNMDEIAHNRNIDAVYIALPNSMHAEYTIRAAKAGKHVLCEKPMATSVDDCRAMIAACKEANVKLMIAYRCQYEPSNLRAIELIRSGKLGTIQAIESANGFNIRAGEWRLDKKLAGGGPLMDMGVYSLNGCRYLTGEEPAEIKAVSSVIDHDGRFNEVEENVSWTMKFPSGIVASCNTSYGAGMNGFYRVHGSKGTLEMESAFGYQGQHLTAQLPNHENIDELNPARDPSQFVNEANYFASCVFENKTPKTAGEEGLRDVELISEIYKSSGRPGL
ncbi:Gfo/Idh/MocA family protein [Paracidobacterium acidisoli]|uniref:Gfo/Idh/MocA family oxidoreductase n=1 Tax=Paracidobacterium acidisoli TaxID=2303751 RepID=A0A372IMJ0_9BACT|nr:Gfo/Idh/MocA family oxidoreductase [Paracidobacterium acidisoli]MBT9331819.1 Gfo/Idh/MocA family oxidoreductase [Paracidobacterium acidisoli]